MNANDKIFIAGHRGMVGSAICRALASAGFRNVVTAPRQTLDLTDTRAVTSFFESVRPDYVVLAAAKVGGIMANATRPVEFLVDNLSIQTNVITASAKVDVKKLLFLGSSCIYPKFASQPIDEDALLTGALEPTNEPYAIAKIAGIKLCQAYYKQEGRRFISAMPTNLYGPNDNYHPDNAHVLPALIRRFSEAVLSNASSVTLWGSGNPYREFLHADDLADACLFLMRHYDSPDIINVGTGHDVSIRTLAKKIATLVGYTGAIEWDPNKPDGTPKKQLNVSKLTALGWSARIPLDQGLAQVIHAYTHLPSQG